MNWILFKSRKTSLGANKTKPSRKPEQEAALRDNLILSKGQGTGG